MANEIKLLNEKFRDITGGFTETVEIRESQDSEKLNGVDRIKELLTDSLAALNTGNHQKANDILQEARDTTKCGGCQQLIQRTQTDLDYVRNLCILEEEDCDAGAENVAKKIEYIRDGYLGGD